MSPLPSEEAPSQALSVRVTGHRWHLKEFDAAANTATSVPESTAYSFIIYLYSSRALSLIIFILPSYFLLKSSL